MDGITSAMGAPKLDVQNQLFGATVVVNESLTQGKIIKVLWESSLGM